MQKCSTPCHEFNWKGDKTCDDKNNHCGCGWDGGDCCGNTKDYDFLYCKECKCLDPAHKDKDVALRGRNKHWVAPRRMTLHHMKQRAMLDNCIMLCCMAVCCMGVLCCHRTPPSSVPTLLAAPISPSL